MKPTEIVNGIILDKLESQRLQLLEKTKNFRKLILDSKDRDMVHLKRSLPGLLLYISDLREQIKNNTFTKVGEFFLAITFTILKDINSFIKQHPNNSLISPLSEFAETLSHYAERICYK